MIGTGGKVIREITEKTGAKVDITDDGVVSVAAVDGAAGKAAVDWIKSIVAARGGRHRPGRCPSAAGYIPLPDCMSCRTLPTPSVS